MQAETQEPRVINLERLGRRDLNIWQDRVTGQYFIAKAASDTPVRWYNSREFAEVWLDGYDYAH